MDYIDRKTDVVDGHLVDYPLDLAGDFKLWPPAAPVTANEFLPQFVGGYEIKSLYKSSPEAWNPFLHYRRKATKPALGTYPLRGYYFTFNIVEPDGSLTPHTLWVEGEMPTTAFYCPYGPCDDASVGFAPMYRFDSVSGFELPLPSNLDDMLVNAARHCLPGVKAELSAINSLLELKDFKSLFHTVSHLKDSLSRLRNLIVNDPKLKSRTSMSLREAGRRVGDLHLQYAFNIAPLISDIKGVYDSLKQYQAKAKRLVSQSERNRLRHFTMEYSDIADSSERSDPYRHPNSLPDYEVNDVEYRINRYCHYDPAKLHVEMLYSYWFTEWQRQNAALLTLLDYLGINFNPAVIWNAIPWSFAIDWVFGVGRFLDQFKTANMQPVVVIQKALYSITRRRSITLNCDVQGRLGVPMTNVIEDTYLRVPYVPSYAAIQAGGLSPNEVLLGVSLALTRRGRHK